MKKIVFIIITLLIRLSINAFSTTEYDWHVIKNGGENHGVWPLRWVGFKKVDSDPQTKTLTCEGKGINECVIQGAEYECVGKEINHLIDYAIKQQMEDVLSGSYNENIYCEEDNENYNCSVTWSTNQTTGICDIYTSSSIIEP